MSLQAAAHWLHLLAAMLWVGGSLAVALVVQPVLRATLSPEARAPVYAAVGKRFSVLQWWCWGVLLVTGLYKLWVLSVVPDVFAGPYGKVLSVKLCLVGSMVVLSLLHGKVWGPSLLSLSPRDPLYKRSAARMAFWGRVNAALMVMIVGCAALLRYGGW